MYQPAIWRDQKFVATCSRMHCAYNRRSSNESKESVILGLFIIFSDFCCLRATDCRALVRCFSSCDTRVRRTRCVSISHFLLKKIGTHTGVILD